MPNLKEVRNRITSVSSTMQITSAMKMVSAAKLKRAQDAITQMRPYAEKLSSILGNVSATLEGNDNVYGEEREVKKTLVVAISANRGLCGGFNNNINKEVRNIHNTDNSNIDVLFVGKKAFDLLKRDVNTAAQKNEVFDNLNFDASREISSALMDHFEQGDYDRIVLVYNSFKNAATQIVKNEQLLPMSPEALEEETTSSTEYIFNPNKEEILEDLIPKSIHLQFYKALLDSNASEHGARMTAMHKATENAGEMLRDLKLSYNKARQAAITNEILEICAGAEALNG